MMEVLLKSSQKKPNQKELYPDKEIIEGLRSDRDINKYLLYLYETCFRSISNFIRTHAGSRQDAEDIFQEAMCIFINLVRKDRFREEASIKTLLYSICRNLWFQQLRKQQRKIAKETEMETPCPTVEAEIEMLIEERETRKKLLLVFEKMGETCKKILQLFYFERLSPKEILEHVPYKSEHVVRNKKYLCWKKFKHLLDKYSPGYTGQTFNR